MTVKDHLGNRFSSKTEMCKAYNINRGTYNNRINSGWSMQEALTNPVDGERRVKQPVIRQAIRGRVTDHLGNVYATVKDMCETYGISRTLYYKRREAGYSLERTLTNKIVTDHLGNRFRSEEEMCKAYNINRGAYSGRIELGWSLKDALTKPINTDMYGKLVEDHLGNKFSSEVEMCKAHGISRTTYKMRRKSGWNLKDALTKPVCIVDKK